MTKLLYGVPPVDPLTFTAVTLLLTAVSSAATDDMDKIGCLLAHKRVIAVATESVNPGGFGSSVRWRSNARETALFS